VTVTATSPALQVPEVTAVTNEVGEYRLSPLPIGVYELAYDLSGFRPAQRQSVRLTVGFTARVDVALGLATVAETVTVSGAAPVVDVSATSGSTLLTRETLQLTPTSRNGTELPTLAPGVRSFLDVGGNQMVETSSPRAFGRSGAGWATLEGIATSGLSTGGGGGQWDEQAIEEARVQTLGTDAEFGTHGVQLNAIVKSGGNDFHGGANWAQTDHHFQSNNIDEDLEAQGITSGNKLASVYDVGGDLGGRLIRNRLWFYGALRRRYQEDEVLNAFKPDGRRRRPEHAVVAHRKVSYQATPSNRSSASTRGFTRRKAAGRTSSWPGSRASRRPSRRYAKVEWEGSRQLARRLRPVRGASVSEGCGHPRLRRGRRDLVTERITGDVIVAGEEQFTKRDHTKGSLTWYKPNSFHGNHEYKVGVDHSNDFESPGLAPKPQNYHLIYNDGVPFEIAFLNSPTFGKLAARSLSIYLKDSWTIGRRLTLNPALPVTVGARRAARPRAARKSFSRQCFDRGAAHLQQRGTAPALAYDLAGDGKTVLKVGGADTTTCAGSGRRVAAGREQPGVWCLSGTT
jgi:hypothetical protein